jgi:hypothetical protein
MKYVWNICSCRVYETNDPSRPIYRRFKREYNEITQLDILEPYDDSKGELVKVKIYLPEGEIVGYIANHFIQVEGNLLDGKFNKK